MINKTKQKYQVWLVYETVVPQHHYYCSTWLNCIYLFLTWQGSYTVKLTDQKDTMIRGGIVLFGIKLYPVDSDTQAQMVINDAWMLVLLFYFSQ